MCHFGVFLPCTSPHLVMVGPRELARMGPQGCWCWRMMDTSPCWSGKTAAGRRKVVALLQAPDVLPQHLLITQALAEEQSQGRGEGLSERPWGKLGLERLDPGPQLSRAGRWISHADTEVSSRLLRRTSARTPASLWTASAPTTCTRARWATAGLWRPVHPSLPASHCGKR